MDLDYLLEEAQQFIARIQELETGILTGEALRPMACANPFIEKFDSYTRDNVWEHEVIAYDDSPDDYGDNPPYHIKVSELAEKSMHIDNAYDEFINT